MLAWTFGFWLSTALAAAIEGASFWSALRVTNPLTSRVFSHRQGILSTPNSVFVRIYDGEDSWQPGG